MSRDFWIALSFVLAFAFAAIVIGPQIVTHYRFRNQPTAQVAQTATREVRCRWEAPDGLRPVVVRMDFGVPTRTIGRQQWDESGLDIGVSMVESVYKPRTGRFEVYIEYMTKERDHTYTACGPRPGELTRPLGMVTCQDYETHKPLKVVPIVRHGGDSYSRERCSWSVDVP